MIVTYENLQADSRCLSQMYQNASLFAFLGLTWRLASALGQTWWASFALFASASASTALLLLATAAAALLALLILLSASTAFLAGTWAVALLLGASFQFLIVADNEDTLLFDGGLLDFQGGLLGGGAAGAGAFLSAG